MNSPELSLVLSITQVVLAVVILGLVIAVLRAQRAKRVQDDVQAVAAVPGAYQSAAFDGVSPEVVAAITAAVATVWDKDTGFVVRHVRRVDNAPAWNRAGRDDQTYSRL